MKAKVAKFAGALARWVAAGRPTRSAERVAEIFAICEACPQYHATTNGRGSCNACGCQLRKKGGMLNKILWATESCPLPEPKWRADVLPVCPLPPRPTLTPEEWKALPRAEKDRLRALKRAHQEWHAKFVGPTSPTIKE